jgi:hypothetical protein
MPGQAYRPRPRPMISFMISVVPPKIDWTRLSRQNLQSCRRAADSAPKARLHLVSASRGVRAAQSGRRSPARGSSRRAATPPAAAWPRQLRRTSGRGYPSHRRGRQLGQLIAAQLPQILAMHDPSRGSQVRSSSREPPRRNQYLGRGQDAHYDSMDTYGARSPPQRPGRRPHGGIALQTAAPFGGHRALSPSVVADSTRLLTRSGPENVTHHAYSLVISGSGDVMKVTMHFHN